MGFIKAFSGALGGTFADQWKDFYGPRPGVPATAAIFQAVPQGTNAGRGSNTQGSDNIITNGSKIVVPEGTALVTLQDGQITGFIAEPGGFEFRSDDLNSKSMFSGDGILASTVKESWERFKFGGQPGSQQLAFYINLKEIPNNKFGTQGKVRFFDAYLNAQVSVIARGSYTLKITDPLLFVKNFLPSQYLQPGASVFDFADMDNDAGNQLFNEVVGCLQSALSLYTSDTSKQNSLIRVQGDQLGFAKSLSSVVENEYQWKSSRGLEIVKVAMTELDYDEATQKLVDRVAEADAFTGARGNTFMQMSAARGIEAAGENGGGASMAFMGMGMNAIGGLGGLQQPVQQPQAPVQPAPAAPAQPAPVAPVQPAPAAPAPEGTAPVPPAPGEPVTPPEDPYEKLAQLKKLLDEGVITQEDFDKAKEKLLGV